MGPLPFILAAAVLAGLAAAASKSKAATSSTVKPTSTPPTTTTTPTTPVTSLPLAIVNQILASADDNIARAQSVWLRDNGYPKTADALLAFVSGDIDANELKRIAAAEMKTQTAPTKVKGTTEMDRYGSYLLTEGSNDTLYDYAIDSTSIPLVREAAARLASTGDTRAMLLTQHLADLTI